MRRSQRLQPILELAQHKARTGIQAIRYMEQRLEQERSKLNQLQQCKKDYAGSGNIQKKQLYRATTLQSMQTFKLQLEQAIEQQLLLIATVEQQLGQVREQWRQLDSRQQSLAKTQARYHSAEVREVARLEQRELDDLPRNNNNLRPSDRVHKPV